MLGVADNDIIVKINGQEIHRGNLLTPVEPKHFENTLKNGNNLIEIEAGNAKSDQRNPAGLIAKFEIVSVAPDTHAESLMRFSTDTQWEASQDGQTWKTAMVLGDFGMGPWSVKTAVAEDSIYPEYDITAKILSEKGIAVDFDAVEKGLRFFHRQDEKTDYYFVGNRTDKLFHGEVTFRVTGKRASIWDPLTGRIFRTPPAKTVNGTTSFVLDLAGSQSVFVVFADNAADSNALVWQVRQQELFLDISDDWEVRFDPKRGGLETPVQFPKLLDWSKSETDGIKYYSGIATYRKTFTVSDVPADKRLELDLGNVEVMARVTLNGKDIGTRWIAPYTLDVTDHIQKGENKLEIEVANLWVNRLIGDAKLPAEKRLTWTTFHNAYGADSPLFPSGLIGPIRIVTESKRQD